MSFDQEGLFGRGESWAGPGGPAPAATDGQPIEGVEKRFADKNYGSSAYVKPDRIVGQNLYNLCRVIRNEAANNFAVASELLSVKAGTATQIDGYTITDGQRGIVGDEWLTYSVQLHDLFWGVISGFTTILTALDGGSDNVIAQGAEVSALTSAASSQGTSSGRVKQAVFSGATTPLANEVMHFLGWAMSAATTGQTGLALLVNLRETGNA